MMANHAQPGTGAQEIAIVGAGGFGREIANYAHDAGLTTLGFLDDHATGSVGDLPILGRIEDASLDLGRVGFVIATGEPTTRATLARRVLTRGGRLTTIIHPTAYISRDATLGAGAIACPFSFVGANAQVDVNVALNTYASVGHDAVVGPHCVFSPYSVINGNVILGNGVFLGTHASVTPGRNIQSQTKVAAGAVVTRDVGPGFLVAGNPARGRVMFPVIDG